MSRIRVEDRSYFVDVDGDGEAVVLLHGFTGSSHSWPAIASRLSDSHRIVTVDLLGHGQSDAPPDASSYRFTKALDDLAAIAHQLDLAHAVWLGYSMGGRVALGMALEHPGLVSSLILESASPGLANPDDRSSRQHADAELADRIERDGIAAFVDAWERLPLWHSQATLPVEILARQREIRLMHRPSGLAGSLRGMGTGAQPSFWDRLGDLHCPVLLIAGALDEKFAAIARKMADAIPNAELALIEDAGHAVHLECPDRFFSAVSQFLARNQTASYAVRKERHCGN